VYEMQGSYKTQGSCTKHRGRVRDAGVVYEMLGSCTKRRGRVRNTGVVYEMQGSCTKHRGRVRTQGPCMNTGNQSLDPVHDCTLLHRIEFLEAQRDKLFDEHLSFMKTRGNLRPSGAKNEWPVQVDFGVIWVQVWASCEVLPL